MLLQPGGLDIFYIDESHDTKRYVVTAVRIPFLRNMEGTWHIVWDARLSGAKQWRRWIKDDLKIPTSKELHGVKLAAGRGNFLHGRYNFKRRQAASVYRSILENMNMVPDSSIMSATVKRGGTLYGREQLEAVMYALFQRMRRQCTANKTNAIVFFDQGHAEYRRLYRMAQVYLPTGSAMGGWAGGPTKNLPLNMFIKDGNEKSSKLCYFTQAADLIAYAAFLKIKGEDGRLTSWQQAHSLDLLYDSIPKNQLNLRVQKSPSPDGIVRL